MASKYLSTVVDTHIGGSPSCVIYIILKYAILCMMDILLLVLKVYLNTFVLVFGGPKNR